MLLLQIAYPALGDCIPCLPTKGDTNAVADPRHISENSPSAIIVKDKQSSLQSWEVPISRGLRNLGKTIHTPQ